MTRRKPIFVSAICLLCVGCGHAPSVDIIGSFFPVWMVCLAVSIVFACILRAVLLRLQFESEIGPVALFYPSVVVLFSCLLWLIFFR
jgi:nitrogen fixation/metabolism regulation signal transduction histidine kinase